MLSAVKIFGDFPDADHITLVTGYDSDATSQCYGKHIILRIQEGGRTTWADNNYPVIIVWSLVPFLCAILLRYPRMAKSSAADSCAIFQNPRFQTSGQFMAAYKWCEVICPRRVHSTNNAEYSWTRLIGCRVVIHLNRDIVQIRAVQNIKRATPPRFWDLIVPA